MSIKNRDKVRVYEMEMVEKISYTYYVPARSKAEAMRIARGEYWESLSVDLHEFQDMNSHCHYDYQKPTLAWHCTKGYNGLNYEEWKSEYWDIETTSLDHLEEIDKLDQGDEEE